jgi:putative Mn2+ efflux pump MntP
MWNNAAFDPERADMPIWAVILIAVGLAMDAFAVSVVSGLTIRRLTVPHAFRIAAFFGLFQAVMPIVGWTAGFGVRRWIAAYDHWIAFALLAVVGIKMIYEAVTMDTGERTGDPHSWSALLALSVATSIDALAVGLSLTLIGVRILLPAAIIGAVTFWLSLGGVYLGRKVGHFFEKGIEMAGGLILIGIGVAIVIRHAPGP